MYEEHTLPNGDVITLDNEYYHRRAWRVTCYTTIFGDTKISWHKTFVTKQQAQEEYRRYD